MEERLRDYRLKIYVFYLHDLIIINRNFDSVLKYKM